MPFHNAPLWLFGLKLVLEHKYYERQLKSSDLSENVSTLVAERV